VKTKINFQDLCKNEACSSMNTQKNNSLQRACTAQHAGRRIITNTATAT